MALVHFLACDRDSGATLQDTCDFTTEQELQDAWAEFEQRVPFTRWYSDNTCDDCTIEQEGWVDDLG